MVAADWAIKQAEGLSASEQDAFFQWLAEDPRHGEQFAKYRDGWRDFNLLAEWKPEHSMEPNPDLLEVEPPVRRWMRWGAGSLAIAAALALVFRIGIGGIDSSENLDGLRIASTNYVYQVLSDGSEVDMRQGAEILVEYTKDRRLVRLLSGEVHFTVAKNPNRPFVVDVGSTEVHAVGTAFNVKLDADEVGILVTEGKIRVDRNLSDPIDTDTHRLIGTRVPLIEDVRTPETFRSDFMVSGQHSTMDLKPEKLEEPVIQTLPEAEVEKLLFWKHKLLDFDETPLSDIVLEFNRRNKTQIIIKGERLKQLPIVVRHRSNEVESFVYLLESYLDINVTREGDETIILAER